MDNHVQRWIVHLDHDIERIFQLVVRVSVKRSQRSTYPIALSRLALGSYCEDVVASQLDVQRCLCATKQPRPEVPPTQVLFWMFGHNSPREAILSSAAGPIITSTWKRFNDVCDRFENLILIWPLG